MRKPDPCSTCGSDRPADSPGGLCPYCLMQIGLLEDAEPDEGEASALERGTEPRQWIPKHETTIELGESIRQGARR